MLLDGQSIRAWRQGRFERARRTAREDFKRRRAALDRAGRVGALRPLPKVFGTGQRPYHFRMKISAVLLAGGESRRMGRDKASIALDGKLLWQNQLELLRTLNPTEIFISARSDPEWRPHDVMFVADIPPSRG